MSVDGDVIESAVGRVLAALRRARSRPRRGSKPPNYDDWQGVPVPKKLRPNSNQHQVGSIDSPVIHRPSVIVEDQHGGPLPFAVVRFAVPLVDGGMGTVKSHDLADENGKATVREWILGPNPGMNKVIAVADGLEIKPPLEFVAEARLPHMIVALPPQHQVGKIKAPVQAPAVKVTDKMGNPCSGVGVHFEVILGRGLIGVPDVRTDESGEASVGDWVLGPNRGENKLIATAVGLESKPLEFTADAAQ